MEKEVLKRKLDKMNSTLSEDKRYLVSMHKYGYQENTSSPVIAKLNLSDKTFIRIDCVEDGYVPLFMYEEYFRWLLFREIIKEI